MQAHHRRRHRALWVVVGLVVGVALLVALAGRRPVPVSEELPVPAASRSLGETVEAGALP